MSSTFYHHQLTAETARQNTARSHSRRSTQSQIKRKKGRLTSSSTSRVASARPQLAPGPATTVGCTTEADFTDSFPPSEISLGSSDAGFGWNQETASDVLDEQSSHRSFRLDSDVPVAPAPKRLRVRRIFISSSMLIIVFTDFSI